MKLKDAVLALAGVLAATSAHAGYATGKVGQVLVGRMADHVYIELLATEFTSWPCATTHPSGFRYAFRLGTETSKAILATVLTAQASGQSLQVIGNASCTIDSSLEDLQYVVLRP